MLIFELMSVSILFKMGKGKKKSMKGTRIPENREGKVTDLDKKLLRRIDP